VAKKNKAGGGCGALVGLVLLVGLTIAHWRVAVPIIVVVIIIAIVAGVNKSRKESVASAAKARKELPTLGVLNPDDNLQARTDKEVIAMDRALTSRPSGQTSFRDMIVTYSALGTARPMAERTSNAVAAILASPEYKAGTCGAVQPSDLRRQAWEIAVALRDIAERRAELPTGKIGPITAPVVAAQKHAITIAEDATRARVNALDHYAAQVAKADAARRDWTTAQEAAKRNDKYLDLVARTAADQHATADLSDLGASAAEAARILQETLTDATFAAETLAL
jgi:hypothetical protein